MGAFYYCIRYIFLLLFAIHITHLDAQCDRVQDSLILIDIYKANPQSHSSLNWDTSGASIDTWEGVRTGSNGCVQGIELIDRQLSSLPESIGQLSSLRYLILHRNQLTTLPESISEIESLSTLEADNNLLTHLPENIGDLDKLTSLSFRDNKLTHLPTSITKLSSLIRLQLFDNNLSNVPENIGDLQSLTWLEFSSNQLSEIPESVTEIKGLRSLFLSNNEITSLPESLGDLENLSSLSVSNNKLTSLPQSLVQLKNLTSLELSVNEIKELPQNIGSLEKLRILNLQFNSLESIPESIGQLDTLYDLNLGNNALSSLPESIGNLDNLWRLFIFSNQLNTLPETISDLESLEILVASDNHLQQLPENIGGLKRLKTLELRYNELKELPGSISTLDSLLHLDIQHNRLEALPENFGDLPRLRNLYLQYNNLESLPEGFGNLKALELLWCQFNKLNSLPASMNELKTLKSLLLGFNSLTFEDLFSVEEIIAILPNASYANQALIYTDSIHYFSLGQMAEINLEVDPAVLNNEYQWTRDNRRITPDPGNSINSNTLIFNEIGLEYAGTYRVLVVNPDFPRMNLISEFMGVRVCDRNNDSLQLVSLYNSTNGPNWGNNENWLTTMPIESWYGIQTDTMGCINTIRLPDNNLEGTLPDLQLNTLDSLILPGNKLVGGMPSNIYIPFVQYVDLSNNELTGPLPDVINDRMQITNLNLGDNQFRESIPPEIGDLCELEELQLEGNGFDGEIPVELTRLFNLKRGQVSFADNVIDSVKQDFIYFCPFGVEIMANNPGGFEKFVRICGDTCSGGEFDRLSDFPWMIDTLQSLDCEGDGCFENVVRSDAGFVKLKGVDLVYTRTICYSTQFNYEESIRFYDCGGYLLEELTCSSNGSCMGFSVITETDFEDAKFDSRWSCNCNTVQCVSSDTIPIDAGEIDTLSLDEFAFYPDNCNSGFFTLYSANGELPGEPPVVTEDNIGFTYELITENLISQAQCTTTIEVVRGSTGRRDFSREKGNTPVLIACQPNPVRDFLWCPEIDMDEIVDFRVFSLQGAEMPVRMGIQQDIFQLMVSQYPSGIYILQVRSQDRIYLNRFTVMR